MLALKQLRQHIASANHIAILTHQNPDGDALGSVSALQKGLDQLGKNNSFVCAQDFAEIFEKVLGKIAISAQLPKDSDLILVLDCAQLYRTGFAKQLSTSKVPVVVIDHHPTTEVLTTKNNIIDQNVASTAELVFLLLNELRVVITPFMAKALLMGIYTDTGGFRHGNATSKTLQVASRLIRYGADLENIVNTFSPRSTIAKKHLWGLALSKINLVGFGFVVVKVTKKMIKECAAKEQDISGLANLLALTEEAKVALVLVETDTGWRATMRSRHSTIHLGKLAKLFGGHGHKNAAGFVTTKDVF